MGKNQCSPWPSFPTLIVMTKFYWKAVCNLVLSAYLPPAAKGAQLSFHWWVLLASVLLPAWVQIWRIFRLFSSRALANNRLQNPRSPCQNSAHSTHTWKKKNYQGLKVNQRQKFMLWWQWVLRRRSENRNPSVKYQVSTKRCGNSLTNQSLTSSSCLFQIFHFYGREIKKLRGKSSGMHKLSAYRNGLKSPGAICDHIPPFK